MGKMENKENLINWAELDEKRKEIYRNDHQGLIDFTSSLKKKYPDVQDYEMWHFLICSSLPPGVKLPKFDFDGEDSVLKFIKDF